MKGRDEIKGGAYKESIVVVTMRGRWTIKRKRKEEKKRDGGEGGGAGGGGGGGGENRYGGDWMGLDKDIYTGW